ncbi:UNVERIFIED_CONTAM: hypothetical protein GTU68_043997, partial [Idotea baltica]|nr:hypothetical protein [Idotea baltica]
GAPTKTRNVSAIALIESRGNASHLIDCGEATQHQILHTRLSRNTLSTIFITHLHADHCYGLPGLLASAGLNGRTKLLRIFAPEGAKEWIEFTQNISELYLPYPLEFKTPNDVSACDFNQVTVSSITLSHSISSFGYAFTESNIPQTLNVGKLTAKGTPQGPLWGKIQAGNNVEVDGVSYKSTDFCSTRVPTSPV